MRNKIYEDQVIEEIFETALNSFVSELSQKNIPEAIHSFLEKTQELPFFSIGLSVSKGGLNLSSQFYSMICQSFVSLPFNVAIPQRIIAGRLKKYLYKKGSFNDFLERSNINQNFSYMLLKNINIQKNREGGLLTGDLGFYPEKLNNEFIIVHSEEIEPQKHVFFILDSEDESIRLDISEEFDFTIYKYSLRQLPIKKYQSTFYTAFKETELPISIKTEIDLFFGCCFLGIAKKTFSLTKNYVSRRKQFGRRIIDNQAIKFDLATLLSEIVACCSYSSYSCWTIDNCTQPDRLIAARNFLNMAKQLAFRATKLGIQFHGALGLLDKSEISHYYKLVALLNFFYLQYFN